jgi:hypothetical protein
MEERKGGDGGEDIDINHDREDSVALLYRCPVKAWDHCKRKINFTYDDIYNHWRDYHRDHEKMSLKVYIAPPIYVPCKIIRDYVKIII